MKKILIITVLLISLLIHSIGYATDIGVIINGKTINFNDSIGLPFIDESNRTQVPLRATMEAFGCDVEWDQNNFCAYVSKDDIKVTVPVGENCIYKNGKCIKNDTVSQIKNDRIYLPIRAVLEAFGGYVSWDSRINSVIVDSHSRLMQIHFIDVGQGDSILIDYGKHEILIDGGDNNKGDLVCDYINQYVDGNIELVIATHPDADHIGGLDIVLDKYNVDKVIDSGYETNTKTYTDYINAVKSEGCIYDNSEFTIELDDVVTLKTIKSGGLWNNSNDMSIVLLLSYGKTNVLFTGDISSKVENVLLDKLCVADVLKIAHHGSKTSTSQEFLNVVKPSYSIISAGANNKYGHPSAETLGRLQNCGSNILSTFDCGNIILNINKNEYSFNSRSYTYYKKDSETTSAGKNDGYYEYVGNINTKKFHNTDCFSGKNISANNRVVFNKREEALNLGYAPCKNCNP